MGKWVTIKMTKTWNDSGTVFREGLYFFVEDGNDCFKYGKHNIPKTHARVASEA